MPITLPRLDDRRYADLLEEARSLIPTVAPEWTNHNPSDPGITLVELFAYLAEMLIYRLDLVTAANVHAFLRLLNGPDWQPGGTTQEALAEDIRNTVLLLRRRERAVTEEDFELLAVEADPRVARARCVPRRNLIMDLQAERPGHMSLIVVPREENSAELAAILAAVEADLDPRRLLTTHLHLLGPFYLPVQVKATLVPLADELLPGETGTDIAERVVQAVKGFLHPLSGGADGKGWPFGRNVFVSEIYELLEKLPGIDYVTAVALSCGNPQRLITNNEGEPVGIDILPHELVRGEMTTGDVTVTTV